MNRCCCRFFWLSCCFVFPVHTAGTTPYIIFSFLIDNHQPTHLHRPAAWAVLQCTLCDLATESALCRLPPDNKCYCFPLNTCSLVASLFQSCPCPPCDALQKITSVR